MASYSAVIDLRVQGQEGLRTVSDRIETINRLIKQIKPVPTLFDARAGAEITDAKNKLSALLKAYADGNTTVAKYSRSLAGLNQQMNSFRTIMANSTVNSDEFNNSLKAGEIASRKLLDAELDRLAALRNIYTRQATGGLTATDQGPSKMVKDLLSLDKKLPDSIAGLNAFQRELLEVQQLVSMNSVDFRELEQAIYKVDVALGKVQFGPVAPPMQGPELPANFIPGGSKTKAPAKGLAGFLGKPGVPDALMGAGFPLLFGGGPGAILGGGAGGFIGGKAGGMGGMALGIAASAIGQLLDQAFEQVAAISSALSQLNMDALRDSVITVNAALDYQVDQLVKAGKADEARALAAAEVTAQTGISAQQLESINGNATRLKNEFDKTLGSLQGTGALLANIFLPALTDILNLVGMVARGWNLIFGIVVDSGQGLKGWFQNLVFGEGTAQKVKEKFAGINEEQQKLSAELERTVDTLLRSAILGTQLGDIDKQRTQNVSLMGKYINIEADRREKIANAESQAAQRLSDERSKYGKLLSDQDKRNLEAVEKIIQAEKRQTVEQANRTAARERFIALNAQLVKQDTLRVAALQMQGEIEKARETATSQVLATQIQELEQRKQIAGTLTGELGLIDAIAAKKKQSAADAFAAAQRDAALQVQIAADELASIERAKLRGEVDELDVQQALKKYNTAVATTQENLRGAAAMQQGAAAATEIEKRLQTVATYTEQYESAAGRATNSLKEAAAAVQNQASYSQALYQAQTTLNNIQIQSLQTALSTTKDTEKRAEIIDRIKDLEIANAEITYQSTVSQIQTQVELLRISYKQLEVEYLKLQAITAIARAQGAVKQGHLDALAAQASALRIAAGNLQTAIKTGDVNIRVAAAVRNAAIGAAELRAQTQGAAEAAGQYAGQMERASSASTSMRDNSFTKKVYGSTTTTRTLPTGTPIPGSKVVPFARGGIVTKPTLAIVGEAGTEYIVPQSKAAGFAANYLPGARGSSAIPSGSGGGGSPTISIQTGPVMQMNGTNYVTTQDLSSAVQAGVQQTLNMMRNDRGTRRAVGLA